MPSEPQIELLSQKTRQRFFWLLVLVFVIALPSLIFYTSGNRLDFSSDQTNIVSMGGIYLSSGYDDIEVYLDEEPVEDRRIFRQAFYIQNVEAGKHRLHVQQEGLQTWVKELPVYPFIVTEVQSFTLPEIPQLRLISERQNDTGAAVVFASTTPNFSGTTTNPFIMSTTTATSTFAIDPEYAFVTGLFSSTTATSTSLLERFQAGIEEFTFSSSATTSTSTVDSATTTVTFQDMTLLEAGSEIVARWDGADDGFPYYFCASVDVATSTAELYGEHVASAIAAVIEQNQTPVEAGEVVCRDTIRIDRMGQDVFYFDFLPGSADLVLLHLEDGIYVTEIDDRAWQNSQLLYPGTDLELMIDGGQIFVRDGEYLFEVFTTIEV